MTKMTSVDDKIMIKKATFVLSSKVRTMIIKCLYNNKYLNPKTLSKKLDKHLSTISRALKELRSENLVDYIEHNHSKVKLYYLTDEGIKVYQIIYKINYDDEAPNQN